MGPRKMARSASGAKQQEINDNAEPEGGKKNYNQVEKCAITGCYITIVQNEGEIVDTDKEAKMSEQWPYHLKAHAERLGWPKVNIKVAYPHTLDWSYKNRMKGKWMQGKTIARRINNVYQPLFRKVCPDGKIPSGKARAEMLLKVKRMCLVAEKELKRRLNGRKLMQKKARAAAKDGAGVKVDMGEEDISETSTPAGGDKEIADEAAAIEEAIAAFENDDYDALAALRASGALAQPTMPQGLGGGDAEADEAVTPNDHTMAQGTYGEFGGFDAFQSFPSVTPMPVVPGHGVPNLFVAPEERAPPMPPVLEVARATPRDSPQCSTCVGIFSSFPHTLHR
jgi:hypothetical protein